MKKNCNFALKSKLQSRLSDKSGGGIGNPTGPVCLAGLAEPELPSPCIVVTVLVGDKCTGKVIVKVLT